MIKVSYTDMNLSLYCLQKEVRVAAAAESVSNAMSLVKNFELFEDNAWWSHRQATATGTHSLTGAPDKVTLSN